MWLQNNSSQQSAWRQICIWNTSSKHLNCDRDMTELWCNRHTVQLHPMDIQGDVPPHKALNYKVFPWLAKYGGERKGGVLNNFYPTGYRTIFKTGQKYYYYKSYRELKTDTVVGGSTDLSAGFEPLFAPAAQPALSAFPVLKGSQMPFLPHELVPHSVCSVWGKGPGY